MKKQFRTVVALMLVLSLVLGIAPVDWIAEGASAAHAASAAGNAPADLESLLEEAAALKAEEQILSAGGWQYVLLPGSGYAVITGYTGESASAVAVPDLLNGADTVGILDGALSGLKNVREIEIPGNVLAIGKNALPGSCVIRSVFGSYAQFWAKKNRHAYTSASSFEFVSGVVDLTGTRPENFIRISEKEIRLRPLEALRLREGTVFFLLDPASPYQISYYRAVSLETPADGYVTVRCETPDVNEVIYRYESTGEKLMIDPSSIRLNEGVTLNRPASGARAIGFQTGYELNMGLDTTIPVGIGDLNIVGNFTNSYKADIQVGFGVKDTVSVEETQKGEFSLALGSTLDKKQDNGKSFGDLLTEKVEKASRKNYNQQLEAPMGSAVVFSVAGVVNLTVSLRYVFEYSGEARISFTFSNVTNYSYKEGQGITRSSSPGEKKWEGSISGKIKTGIEVEVALYIAVVKVASISLFAGVKAEAVLSVELSGATAAALDHLYGHAGNQFELEENVNLNMLDCIVITITGVVEFAASLGVTDNLTLASLRVPVAEFPFGTFHLHFYEHPILQEPVRDTSGAIASYRYTVQTDARKHPLHPAPDCPYRTVDVKFVLPFQNNLQLASLKNLTPGTPVDKPEIDMISSYRRKLLSWHTSSSMDDRSKVREDDWPYPVQQDTTFFAKTVPVHEVWLVDASGNGLAYTGMEIRDTNAAVRSVNFQGGQALIADGESFTLPSKTPDQASDISRWIPVISRATLIQPEGEAAQDPGNLYNVTAEAGDVLCLCALTDHDIEARFHNGLDSTYTRVHVTRNQPITLPEGPSGLLLYNFVGWEDSEGNLLEGDAYSTDAGTPTLIDFYARLELSDFTGVIPLDQIKIGSEIPEGLTDGIWVSSLFELDLNDNAHTAVVSRFNEDAVNYPVIDVRIPSTVNIDEQTYRITGIGAGAFSNRDTLRCVRLPATITEIGTNAFSGCDNLQLIDMSTCSIAEIPDGFASGCGSLRCVDYRSIRSVPIGVNAFSGCTALTAARIAGDIGSGAFDGCTALTTVILENRILSIGSSAFRGCTSLTALSVPGTVTQLGSGIISGCTSLTTLEINAMLSSLSPDVFRIGEGSMLNTLILGGGIRSLSSGCFANNGLGFEHLENLTVSGAPRIGSNAFSGSGIRTLTLNGGSLDYHAFYNLPALQTVVIGDGVTSVGSSAFENCTALETVTIGENVSAVGSAAFRNCTALETVTFRTSRLLSLGESAFENCAALTALEIPETVTSYGSYLIRGCTGLQTLSVGSGISGITSPTYVFMIAFRDLSLKTLIVREGVTSIPDYLFANGHSSASGATGYYSLEEVVLPSTLRAVGREAFWKAGMKKLTVRSAVRLDSNAFAYCDRLEELEYDAGSIADYAFSGCAALRKVTVGNAVSSIGKYAFSDCTGLQTLSIGSGVISIGDDAFRNCTSLTSLTLPDQVESVGINFLSGCTGLTTLSVGSVISAISNFHISPDSRLSTVILREGVTSLGSKAFRNGDRGFPDLSSVSFPSTLTSIGSDAFRGAKLTDVTLPGDVSVGSSAFEDCDRLQSVRMQGGTIGDYAFENCTALSSFSMGGVTSIGNSAFIGCSALKSLTIPDSVTVFLDTALQGCTGLEYLSVGAVADNGSFGTEIKKGGTPNLKTLVLREGFTTIRSDQFSDMPYLTDVSFPSTLESVGNYAFRNSGIRKVDITGYAGIGESAFTNCRQLADVVIGCGSIGKNAFRNCVSLRSFTLRIGSGEIGSHAFDGCTALEQAVLGDGVTVLGSYVFRNCRSLSALAIPDSVRTCDEFLIQGCTGLKTLSVGGGFDGPYTYSVPRNAAWSYTDSPHSALYIGPDASLEQVTFGEGVTRLPAGLLANVDPDTGEIHGYPALRSVSLPESLTAVGQAVFHGSGITELRLRGTVTVSQYAFAGMQSLRRFSMEAGSLGSRALKDCRSLASVTLGKGVTAIGEEAFANCSALGSLVIPDSVSDYGFHMIFGCTGLRNLSLGAGFQQPSVNQFNRIVIGDNAQLEWVEIREGVTVLYEGALANQIGDYAPGFPNLHTVCLPASLTSLGNQNLTLSPGLRHLYLKSPDVLLNYYDDIYYSEDLPAGLNVYTETWNADLAEFCLNHHLNYVVRGQEEYPSWQLTLAVPAGKSQASGESLDASFDVLSRSAVEYAAALNLPSPVPVSGWSFFGWYTDPDFTCEWTGPEMPARDLTLYARIEKNTEIVFAVNLAAAGSPDSRLPSGFSAYQAYSLKAGDPFPVPQEPQAEYYAFAGWYLDPAFTLPCRLTGVPGRDTVIYGRMDRLSAGAVYTRIPGGLRLTRYILQEGEPLHLELPARIGGEPVISIAAGAFENCAAHSIRIPETVTEIDEGAFRSGHAFRLRVAADNPAYLLDNGLLYDAGRTTLLYCTPEAVISYYTRLPSALRRIASYAFRNNTGLSDIRFPDGLQEIGVSAFEGCTGLYSVTLPDSVTRLQRDAFKGCSGLASFTAMGLTELEYWDSEKDLYYETFPDNGILRVYGPVGTGVLREAFLRQDSSGNEYTLQYNLYALTGVINGSRESMYCEAGQKLDRLLAETVLEDGTVIYGWFRDSALTDPWNLDTDVMPASSLTLYASSAPPFAWRTGEVTDENGVSRSGAVLTLWNGAAASLVIPAAVGSSPVVGLDAGFLSRASGLSMLTVPSSVVFIDENALLCADGPFSGTVVAEPDSYAARWAQAHHLSGDEPVHFLTLISDNETVMTLEAVQGTALLLPELDSGGRTFTGWSTLPYSFSAPPLEEGVYCMPGQDVTLYAFWEGAQDSVFTWTLREGRMTVTGYTGSSSVLILPAVISGIPVTAIGDRAFENRDDLTRVVLPDSLTEIGAYAFSRCAALRECSLPSGLLRIGDGALAGTCLSAVTLPDSLTDLGKGAFSGCAELYQLHLGRNVRSLTSEDLAGCTRLAALSVTAGNDSLKAADGVLFTADGAVLLCYPVRRGMSSYTVPDGTAEIAAGAFRNNPDLESVVLPADVSVLGSYAFAGCQRLARFSAGGLTEIGNNAFFACPMLSDVTLGNQLQSIGRFAFVSNPSLLSLALPSTLQLDSGRLIFDNDTGLVLTGTAGSSAQAYAMAWGLAFVDPDAPSVTAVALSASELTMDLGASGLLTASVLPASSAAALSWSSGDPAVVRVENGTLYAVGTGTSVVTVTAGNGVSASCTVTVTPAFRSVRIRLIPPLKAGDTAQLYVTADPDVPAGLRWSSSNPAVASVDASGLLTAGNVGSAVVTVTAPDGTADSMPVTVYQPAAAVTVSAPSDHLYAVPGNNTLQLSAEVQPADATFRTVFWSSSDLSVAAVDRNGLVTARKAGTVTVTAATEDPEAPSASFTLTVDLLDLSGGSLSPASVPYSGKTAAVAGVLADGLLLAPDQYTVSWTGSSPFNAGEYSCTVSGNGTTTAGRFTGTLTVTRAVPQITFVDYDLLHYYGPPIFYETDISGLPTDVTYRRVLPDGSLGPVGEPEENGIYEITVTVPGSANVEEVSASRQYMILVSDEIVAPSAVTLPLGVSGKLPVSCIVYNIAPYWYQTPAYAFTSSDPAVVSVSSGGVLTALSAGTAVVTIRETNNEGASAECTVTVLEERQVLSLPAALLEIGEEAFMGDSAARYIRIGSGTRRIGPKAFAEMSGLRFVEIPASVKSIAADAFSGSQPVLLCPAGSWAENYAMANGIRHFSVSPAAAGGSD